MIDLAASDDIYIVLLPDEFLFLSELLDLLSTSAETDSFILAPFIEITIVNTDLGVTI